MSTASQIIVWFYNPQPVGHTFKRHRDNWPFHVTLLPWFDNADQVKLEANLSYVAGETPAFSVIVGSIVNFGVHKDIPVNEFGQIVDFRNLHTALLTQVTGAGGSLQTDTFTGMAFRPHITRHKVNNVIEAGEHCLVRNFSLVERQHRPDGDYCEVIQHFPLGGL